MPFRYDYESNPNSDYLGKQLLDRYKIEQYYADVVEWQTQLSQKQPPNQRTGSIPVIGTKLEPPF